MSVATSHSDLLSLDMAARAVDRAARTGEVQALPACAHGATVRITRLDGVGEDVHRLREVGVYEGAEVVVMTGGDPVILSVFNTRFAISHHVAQRVFIQAV